ncbi:MAG: HlyD family secretion protein [Planctomycetota bacterium]|jgi:HlyD family secretion protein
MKRKSRGGLIVFLLVVSAGAAVAWGATRGGWFRGNEEVELAGASVRRGDLLISELVRGNLEAKDSIVLRSEIERETTILFLVEEGTRVNKGDLVAELDVSELADREVAQEIEVKSAEAQFTKAREQYEIQEIQNETDMAQVRLDLELAEMDLEKYIVEDGAWTHELTKAKETIAGFKNDLLRAQNELDNTKILFEKGFTQKTELEADQDKVRNITVAITQSERECKLKENYENTRESKKLAAEVETRKRDIQKTSKQAIARLADLEAERESASYRLTREENSLKKMTAQLSKAKIYAPEEGIVVYGRKRSRWGGGEPVEEGGQVYERQEIVTMPRQGGMTVEASLHETRLKKVRVGQRCRMTIDAMPGLAYDGYVSFVAVLPDSGSYFSNPNARVYKAEVTIDEAVEGMRPGMSCNIEILVENLKDVLFVPRQAVYFDGDRSVAFVNTPSGIDTREVNVGSDNARWVSIEEGLEEGEVVLLSPPADFDPAPRASSKPEGERGSADMAGKGPVEMPKGAEGGAGSMRRGMPSGMTGGKPSGKPGGMTGGKPGGMTGGKPGGRSSKGAAGQ